MIKICTDTRNQLLAFRWLYNTASISKIIKTSNGKVTTMTFDGRKRTIVKQGSINARRQVAAETKFCTVTPNICGRSVQNLFHTTLLVPRSMMCLPDFWIFKHPFVPIVPVWTKWGKLLNQWFPKWAQRIPKISDQFPGDPWTYICNGYFEVCLLLIKRTIFVKNNRGTSLIAHVFISNYS